MKKLFLVLMIGLFLSPLQMFADNYECDQLMPFPEFPVKGPVFSQAPFSLNKNNGDFIITPNFNISELYISIAREGVTYLNTTVSLNAGQSYTNSFAGYDVGTYILTMSTSDGVIAQYEITVEAD
jgi:hypothetical protein